MSALARWFNLQESKVYGYDKTSTPLTTELENLGIEIHFVDSLDLIPENVKANPESALVVYTPAIPEDHKEYNYLKENGFSIKKRSEVLGDITRDHYTVAVAGTHGKTTTSTMIAHLLKHAGKNISAFLGGIATNYNSNFIEGHLLEEDAICVVEADEYDRSFLRLHPDYAVITSMDADHLDIYGEIEALKNSFRDYLNLIPENGKRLINAGLDDVKDISGARYGIDQGHARAFNIRIEKEVFQFDFSNDNTIIRDLALHQPGYHNVENAVAAIKVCLDLGVDPDQLKKGLRNYEGVKRRFEYILRRKDLVYVDDYAHHPVEIEAFLRSLRALYPSKKLTAVFQPHLFSRTRDFAIEFAESLDKADEVFLLEIYPAREEPIEGVTSEIIFRKMKLKRKYLTTRDKLISVLVERNIEVLATIGAGDIDQLVEPLKIKLSA